MNPHEPGITETVKTFFSSFTVGDIVRYISSLKSSAVTGWLEEVRFKPENALIIGSYFTGAAISGVLDCRVTVADINPQTRFLLGEGVDFQEGIHDLGGDWDLIVDTTGIGGVTPRDLSGLTAGAFIVEDPTSDGSDETIMGYNSTAERLEVVESDLKASLHTLGLGAKTSGTMTLTVEALRRSMADALECEGVLYATATLRFFERILFREKDPDGFLRALESPALTISSLKDISCDDILEGNLGLIRSEVRGPQS
ncbi:DUF1188 domain-containing protein [Methanothermobacter thermautotrophicus]|uniref:DUF1188 domain-containing protein n=1 Tax=Methanothermobacter thermautotrophicus TaxID=145262 RepID=A0A842YL36_METTF|nr:DUF1188 domain-containing protein [Methanothermobacter thermautotrophicus]MBE2900252.1 DUF1188 domain-containing protein [Methanothermobacter thermautotrophicus]